jgi:hypothetical protein
MKIKHISDSSDIGRERVSQRRLSTTTGDTSNVIAVDADDDEKADQLNDRNGIERRASYSEWCCQRRVFPSVEVTMASSFAIPTSYDEYTSQFDEMGRSILDWADSEKKFRGFTEV